MPRLPKGRKPNYGQQICRCRKKENEGVIYKRRKHYDAIVHLSDGAEIILSKSHDEALNFTVASFFTSKRPRILKEILFPSPDRASLPVSFALLSGRAVAGL